ncbi:glycosyltransferase family 4 protein [Geobacillus subterraneus]|uniref:glycosyltransferase family 4 protein n=1 Tax=Geobacillus subterraneus TaxID=129338 RepID=UPI002AC8AA2B|nr:glycosyltransferase family 4 protein [Geobacillus subterraneus]WPZ19202.1 glycosyltransferase family 4 protein [Geobacillus subterraneus]
MMRVLMVLDGLDFGGTETHTLSLAKEMAARGIHIAVAARSGALVHRFRAVGCPFYPIDFPAAIDIDEQRKERLVEQLEAAIQKENISIVHAHQTPSGILAALAAHRRGIPVVFTAHGTYYPPSELETMLRLASAAIAVSPPVERHIRPLAARRFLIPNGIDTNEFAPLGRKGRQALGIPDDALVIVYSSRLAWAKASICFMLLKACKDIKRLFPNVHAVVVGDGPRFSDVENLVRLIHQTCRETFIHLVGEQSDMALYYSLADLVVGTGRVALEAMACGKPVLAAGNHGYFGLVEPNSYDDAWECYFGDHGSRQGCSRYILSQDIKRLLQSPLYREQLGQAGREWIMRQFHIQTCVDQVLNVYESLLKGETKR